MPERKPARRGATQRTQPSLSLKIESAEPNNPYVDADDFLHVAERWLKSLKTFASEQGKQVKWEIVDLRQSSALIEVQPVKIKNHKPLPSLAKKWEEGLRKIEKTGRPPAVFTPQSLAALKEFVSTLPQNAVVQVGNHSGERLRLTALTQRRVEEASKLRPVPPKREYSTKGSIRGRLAVLDSWKPEQRFFSLQLPLDPNRPVKCTYVDKDLVAMLGDSFEGTVEITGTLHYKPDRPWPSAVDVENIRPLHEEPVGLKQLVGLLKLPAELDSVSYIRSVRDAD
jgi:hypothetical protein